MAGVSRERTGVQEEHHRGNALITAYPGRLPATNGPLAVDLDHLARVMFAGFVHCSHHPLSRLCSLEGVTKRSLHSGLRVAVRSPPRLLVCAVTCSISMGSLHLRYPQAVIQYAIINAVPALAAGGGLSAQPPQGPFDVPLSLCFPSTSSLHGAIKCFRLVSPLP